MMPDTHDRIIDELMEQLVAQGPGGMAAVFTRLFNLAMRFERENYLNARHYERTDERRGYANGIKPKRIDTAAGRLRNLRSGNLCHGVGTVLAFQVI